MSRRATIAVSLAGLPFIVPHVVEDFAEGLAPRLGLATPFLAFLLGGYLALQSLGLVLVGLDRRAGFLLTSAVGAVWTIGAVFDHGPAIAAGDFRSGAVSVAWVVGLVVSQATAAVLAGWGWRRAKRA